MAKQHLVTGIDVGSREVRVVICDMTDASQVPKIVGKGSAESRGLRRGYIVNKESAAKQILLAVSRAEKDAGVKIENAFFAASGVGMEGTTCFGSALVSQSSGEVSAVDVERARISAENSLKESANKKILHVVPIEYKLDGKDVLGQPEGMKGVKLAVKVLLITAQTQHINDLVDVADMVGIEAVDALPSTIASSWVTLSKRERMAGCVLVDIGGETTTMTVFENGLPLSLKVLPIGTTDITNDIALALQISLSDAEKLRQSRYGGKKEEAAQEAVEARLVDLFGKVEEHLKTLSRNELLPAGVILLGSGTELKKIESITRECLHLPVSKASLRHMKAPSGMRNSKTEKNMATWAVAYGLCILGSQSDQDESAVEPLIARIGSLGQWIGRSVRHFLP